MNFYEMEMLIKLKQEQLEKESKEAWKYSNQKQSNTLNFKRIFNNLFNLNRECCECN